MDERRTCNQSCNYYHKLGKYSAECRYRSGVLVAIDDFCRYNLSAESPLCTEEQINPENMASMDGRPEIKIPLNPPLDGPLDIKIQH